MHLSADKATVLGLDGSGLVADASWEGGVLELERLAATDLGGVGFDAKATAFGTLVKPEISGLASVKIAQGSAALTQAVKQDGSNVTLKSGTNPSVFGQPVTFTATVSAAGPGAGAATGTVNFFDGGTLIGTGTLSTVGGQQVASTAFSGLSVSPPDHAITATYVGDSNSCVLISRRSDALGADPN